MFGKRIENRILVGVTSFVGIMVLVGWVAINEGGRMQAFERQFDARSIERGAALFATNCTTCHGVDGRGILGRAPALNNPQLFGHNFVGVFDEQIASLKREMTTLQSELANGTATEERIAEINARLGTGSIAADLYLLANPPQEAAAASAADPQALRNEQTTLETERAALQTELSAEGLAEERISEINARIAEINARLGVDTIPYQLLDLQAQRDAVLNSLGPAIEKGYDPEAYSRLNQLGWAGSLEAFLFTTLVHGRPTSGQYWPAGQAMPAWSQQAGGPLRNDQLRDLVAYIMNWDKGANWTLEDLFAVQQFAIVPGAQAGGPLEPVAPDPTAIDVAAITAEVMALTGDPQNGQTLYNSASLACAGCHVANAGVVAPALDGTWTRTVEQRLTEPRFAGYTGEQYLVESILLPNAHTVAPYAGVMPTNFGERLDLQMLADLVAYLKSQDGPSPE